MNKQRKVLITTTYNEMGIIIDTKAEEVAQTEVAKDTNVLTNDCISREAAIDATWFEPSYTDPLNVLTEVRDRLKVLPSAQPKSYREGYQAGYKDAQSETAERTAEKAQNVSDEDLISRKAAIDALVKDCKASDEGMLNMYDIVCDLKDVPSAQPYTDKEIQKIQDLEQAQFDKIHEPAYQEGRADAMRWIPLSEKFPQEDEDVLLQFPSNQGVGYYEDGDWMINTGDGIYSIIGYNEEKPIAWMPLPEPYKEDEQG